jgi:hypothetical protein
MPGQASAANRVELCARLSRQVDLVVLKSPNSKQAAAARILQKKADRLCQNRKPSQGIRIQARALRLICAKPVLDNQ